MQTDRKKWTKFNTDWQRKWLDMNCHDPKLQVAADAIQDYIRRLSKDDRSNPTLVLVGENGSGKTHISRQLFQWTRHIATHLWTSGKWDHIPSYLLVLWSTAADAFKDGQYGSVRDMVESDILIVDDLGAEHDPSKSALNKFCQILSQRENKFNVITTNIRPDNWSDAFDTRVADRLLRGSVIVDLTGVKSYALRG